MESEEKNGRPLSFDGAPGEIDTGGQAQRIKGELTRQRRYEARQEKKRLKLEKELLEAKRRQQEDERFMKEALSQAKKAAGIGDVPIGCIIVKDGVVIARGYNRRNRDANVLSHAEILAVRGACEATGDWRLEGCTLYVTLEPCPMCAGAIVQARMDRVVIGCMNPKAGSAGSVINLMNVSGFNHHVQVRTGVLAQECRLLMEDFFRRLRMDKRAQEGDG